MKLVTWNEERKQRRDKRRELADACPVGDKHDWRDVCGFDGTGGVIEYEECRKCLTIC